MQQDNLRQEVSDLKDTVNKLAEVVQSMAEGAHTQVDPQHGSKGITGDSIVVEGRMSKLKSTQQIETNVTTPEVSVSNSDIYVEFCDNITTPH